MKNILKIALSESFLPFSIALMLLVIDVVYLLLVQYVIVYSGSGIWGLIDFFIFLTALVLFGWMCVNVLISLIKGDWRSSLIRACIVALSIAILVPTAGVNIATVTNMPTSPDDLLGKDIVIPAGMIVNEPKVSDSGPIQQDPLISDLMKSWSQIPGDDVYSKTYNQHDYEDVEVKIKNVFLPDLDAQKETFLRHFATDAKWEVQKKENGWVVNLRTLSNHYWNPKSFYIGSLHQYNGEGNIQISIEDFPSLKRNYYKSEDGEIVITTKAWRGGIHTNPTFTSGNTHYTVNERAYTDKRIFTNKALNFLNRELSIIRHSQSIKTQGFEPSIIASGSIKQGKEEFELRSCPEAGPYCLDAFVNPGEWGYVYLKAFEATSDKPLSNPRLRQDTSEYVGWSSNPEEKFAYNANVFIDEGGSKYRFPARFEIWFHPENPNHQERKILEKTYWIHGWEPSESD